MNWNERNNVRLTIGLNSMNELKSRVSSKFKPAAAGLCQFFFCADKKINANFCRCADQLRKS